MFNNKVFTSQKRQNGFNSLLILDNIIILYIHRNTTRSDFVFTADRLIRLVIEEGLNILPCSPRTVQTSSGLTYEGLQFDKGNCGVSIIRSGMYIFCLKSPRCSKSKWGLIAIFILTKITLSRYTRER